MLSPDPVTQAPENGQNYDRYTYAFNNPLKYKDPSGYKSKNKAEISCSDSCISNAGASGVGMEEVRVVAQDLSSSGSGNLAPLTFGMSSQQAISNEIKEYTDFNVAVNNADQALTLNVENAISTNGVVGKLSSGDVLDQEGNVIKLQISDPSVLEEVVLASVDMGSSVFEEVSSGTVVAPVTKVVAKIVAPLVVYSGAKLLHSIVIRDEYSVKDGVDIGVFFLGVFGGPMGAAFSASYFFVDAANGGDWSGRQGEVSAISAW